MIGQRVERNQGNPRTMEKGPRYLRNPWTTEIYRKVEEGKESWA
jgi:hypothetical protein